MRVYDFNEIDSICFEINNGKAAIIETDTVMGIVSKNSQLIYSVKKRSTKKKLVIFVPSIRDVPNLTPNQVSVLKEFWPGALTIIKNNIGYRIPNHEKLLALIEKTGPIFSSSANISGKTPIRDHNEAKTIFDKWSDKIILVEGKQLSTAASTIIDIDHKKVIRAGLLDGRMILEQLGK